MLRARTADACAQTHRGVAPKRSDQELEAAIPVREEEDNYSKFEHADGRGVELDELLLPSREIAEEARDAQQPQQLDHPEDAQQREGLRLHGRARARAARRAVTELAD